MIQALVSSREISALSAGASCRSRAGSDPHTTAQQKQQDAYSQEYVTSTTQNTFTASYHGSKSSGIAEYGQVALSPMCP